jgi:hypothetical protein
MRRLDLLRDGPMIGVSARPSIVAHAIRDKTGGLALLSAVSAQCQWCQRPLFLVAPYPKFPEDPNFGKQASWLVVDSRAPLPNLA